MQGVVGLVSLSFGLFLIIVICSWFIKLWSMGPRGMLGYERLVLQTFETAVLYSKGRFSRVLTAGEHWVRSRSAQVIRVDLRPETFAGEQWVNSADGVSTFVKWSARSRVEDARKLVEGTKNYGSDVFCRIQSCVKAQAMKVSCKALQARSVDSEAELVAAVSVSLAEIGCTCLGFEFLDVRPSIDLQESREVGFACH